MATIRGTYKKDLKVKDNWRLFIAMMPFAKNGQLVETKCAGVFTPMYEGQPFTFIDELESYKGSETFKVKSYTAEMPKGLEESMAFIRSVKGIGKKRGEVICEYCDGDLTRLSMDDVEKLKPLCHGLKEESLKKLIDRLNQVKMIGELQKTYGTAVTVEELSKIVTKFENSVERVMKYHPYWTAPVVGFKVADRIGEIDKVKPNDIERLSAAVRHNLNELCRKYGSAMAVLDELIAKTMSMLQDTKLGGVVIADIHKAINAMWTNQEVRCTCNKKYIYPKKNLDNEKLLAEFVVYNTGKVSQEKQDAFKKAFADWCVMHREMQLSAMQTAAVWMGGTNVVSVLTGGPGTGKTTCLQALIDSYAVAFPDEKITLLAPTGLAAKRMSEKTGRPAKTIHSAFRLIPTDDDEKDEFAPDYNDALVQRIDAGLVVVDECSMLGLNMAAFLIEHCDFSSGRCQIVLVGDVDQLPSISAGSVLLHLISSGAVPVTVLDRNFRQSNQTGIPELASEINSGKSVLSLTGGCSFDSVDTSNKELVCKEITEQYIKAIKEHGIKNVLVLVPYRKECNSSGPICTDKLNPILRDAVNPAAPNKKEMKIGERIFREGDRIINLKNATDCVNGDIGTVVKVSADGETMTIELDCGSILEFEKSRVAKAIDLAYTVTVHKSQGGEYSAIIMPFVRGHEYMLYRQLTYTAITRAKKQFLGIGDINLLKKAGMDAHEFKQPRDLLDLRIIALAAKKSPLHNDGGESRAA